MPMPDSGVKIETKDIRESLDDRMLKFFQKLSPSSITKMLGVGVSALMIINVIR